jgi:hypothetical protein
VVEAFLCCRGAAWSGPAGCRLERENGRLSSGSRYRLRATSLGHQTADAQTLCWTLPPPICALAPWLLAAPAIWLLAVLAIVAVVVLLTVTR